MTRTTDTVTVPLSREPVTLLSVDRAVSDLRRGRSIVIRGSHGNAVLVLAAEAVTAEALSGLSKQAGTRPMMAITTRRAAVLGFRVDEPSKVVSLSAKTKDWSVKDIQTLADPLEVDAHPEISSLSLSVHKTFDPISAAVQITKIARLLPAALVASITLADSDDLNVWAGRFNFFVVDAGDIFQYDRVAARTLRAVSEATVPLNGCDDTKIIAYRPLDGGLEHLAIVLGDPDLSRPVLTRLHSECFTGDLLGSLRCDCGDQLRGAIAEIAKANGGILLYLAQEGRGIGLVNKLRAYQLQDQGADTMDANEQLGFDADERVYLPAARMLRHLGVSQVKLLTNNPDKVQALATFGVDVVERVSHAFPSNHHNEAYLQTKAAKGGHTF